MSLCLYLSSLQGRRIQSKREASAGDVLWLQSYHSFNLKLFELNSVGATPAPPGGVCLSISLFVHSVWQVVAWDTRSRINLQGLPVYEKHPRLFGKGALCSQFTRRSKSSEPNSACSFIISAASFAEWGDYRAVAAPRSDPILFLLVLRRLRRSPVTSRPHRLALFHLLQPGTYGSERCIFHFGS